MHPLERLVGINDLSPLGNLVAILICECAKADHDEVDQRPDGQSTEGQNLKNCRAVFTDIETMCTEYAKEKAKPEGRKNSFVSHGRFEVSWQ